MLAHLIERSYLLSSESEDILDEPEYLTWPNRIARSVSTGVDFT